VVVPTTETQEQVFAAVSTSTTRLLIALSVRSGPNVMRRWELMDAGPVKLLATGTARAYINARSHG